MTPKNGMTKEMVRVMPVFNHVEKLCDTCVLTKQRRCAFPYQAKYRVLEQLEHSSTATSVGPSH